MNSEWRTQRLGELCEIIKGRKPKLKKHASLGDLPYLAAKIMRGSQDSEFADINDRNSVLVSQGETIIICDGSSSGEVFTGFHGILSSTMGKIVKKIEIDDDYLRFFLRSKFEVLNRGKTGAAIPHLDKDAFYALDFSYPSLYEQRRIVAILDEAFENIAIAKINAEMNMRSAAALFDCYLENIDGPKVSLGEVVNIRTGKLDVNAAVEGGAYPFFTCAREIYSIDKYAFDCEALLLAGNNAVGDFNVKHYKGKFNAYQRTYVITIKDEKKALCRFLYFELLKGLAKFKLQSVGAATKFLKIGMINDLQIALPEVHEQRRIASLADQVRQELATLSGLYEKKLAELEELKKSILHQAFTGQL